MLKDHLVSLGIWWTSNKFYHGVWTFCWLGNFLLAFPNKWFYRFGHNEATEARSVVQFTPHLCQPNQNRWIYRGSHSACNRTERKKREKKTPQRRNQSSLSHWPTWLWLCELQKPESVYASTTFLFSPPFKKIKKLKFQHVPELQRDAD